MPRHWTRRERREHLREKYYSGKEKAFVTVTFLFALFLTLSLALSGMEVAVSVHLIAGVLIVLIALLFFLVTYGDAELRPLVLALAAVFIILAVVAAAVLIGTLEGIARFAASVILGIIFLVLVIVAAFFIDVFTRESG